jgi:Carboxypeptidase regulatory-like domain/TonB dependent receptor
MESAFRPAVIRILLALLVLSLGVPMFLAAQQDVASLTGVVSDPSDAVLPDVNVKLTDTKTNSSYETKTNSLGAYRFSDVHPGPGYKLTFSKHGFTTLVIADVYLATSTIHTQNARMDVGEVSVTVEVEGTGSTVSLDTTDSSVGNSVDMNMVREMPIQVRDSPLALVAMQPGAVTVGQDSPDDPMGNRNGAVTGARSDQDNVTLDGLDVNDFSTGQALIAVGNAPVDSIQEFHVETANPLAAEGRGSGAQINLLTKSGTNLWHGSAFEYNRNTDFEANTFFNNRTDPVTPRENLIRNQFGGTFGGPVKKDKLFFFFSYDGRRDHTADSEERIVPLDSFRAGNVSYINDSSPACSPASRVTIQPNCITALTPAQLAQAVGGPCPGSTLTPPVPCDPQGLGTNTAFFAFVDGRYPHANDLTAGDGVNTGGFRFNAPAGLTENDYVARVDYNLNSKMKLFGRFSIQRQFAPDDVNFAGAEQFPGDPTTHGIVQNPWAFVIGHTWTISNTKVNQFYFGETRAVLQFTTLFNPNGTTDYNAFGPVSVPFQGQGSQGRTVPIPVYRDDLTWTQGKHTWQFGGTFKPIKTNSQITNDLNFAAVGLGGGLGSLPSAERPSDILQDSGGVVPTLWDNAFTFALGRFASVGSNFDNAHNLQPLPQGSPAVRNYRYWETEFYLQDSWRMRSDFTLTYGLRYQYYSVPYETNGIEAIPNQNFHAFLDPRIAAGDFGIPGAGSLVSYNFAGKGNSGAPSLYGADYNGLAPRLAFAYNPAEKEGFMGRLLGDRKTVIRGGAGVVFDHPVTNTLNFVQDQVSYIFENSSTTEFGDLTSSPSNPRFTAPVTLPALTPPSAVTVPFTPFTTSTGLAFGTADGGQVNYAVDNNLKMPYSITFTLGFQRELPHNFQLDVTYFGRLGRRLISQSDGGQVVNFTDPASGHTLAGDFAALSNQVRQPGFNPQTTPVTPLPFFENQMGLPFNQPNGTAFCQGFDLNCTQFLYDQDSGQVTRGDLGDATQLMQELPLFFGEPGYLGGVGLNPQFGGADYISNQGSSNYHGLLTTLHKKFSQGLQFDLNYTYSHSIDNSSTITNNVFGQANDAGGVLCDSINLRSCRGNSDFDVTHLISFGGLYELPVGRGKMLGSNMPGWLNEVVGGWQISTLATWHTGFAYDTIAQAFPVSFLANTPGIFNGDTAAIKTKLHTDPTTGQETIFANPAAAIGAFSGPLGLQSGNRNILRGPHYADFDIGLGKHFPIKERLQMELRADAFNAFNHPNFGLPQGGFTDITNPSVFGVITATSAPRQLQVAFRLDF